MKNRFFPKEQFVSILEKLWEANDLVGQVNELLAKSRGKVDCSACSGEAMQISHESIVVELLAYIMQDDGAQIEHFIYGTDFGRKPDDLSEERRSVKLTTAEALYDYLIGNMMEKEEQI
ncbi:MAG: hypothetical protein NC347_06300 [Clostridium sp.]|nr:hypothetical protein [Clostridium sp.]